MRSLLPEGLTVQVSLYVKSDRMQQVFICRSDELTGLLAICGLKAWQKHHLKKMIKSLNKAYSMDDFRLMTRLEVLDYIGQATGAATTQRH